jgi:hypothetical protein
MLTIRLPSSTWSPVETRTSSTSPEALDLTGRERFDDAGRTDRDLERTALDASGVIHGFNIYRLCASTQIQYRQDQEKSLHQLSLV